MLGWYKNIFFTFPLCILQSALFLKTVAKMLLLSVSRESIGVLTIYRYKVLRSTPPSRGNKLILRLKMRQTNDYSAAAGQTTDLLCSLVIQ